MAEKVTEYTPKSQNFIDTDLFDVSKHVTQTSGVLVVGKRYTILDFNAGDNFTNVASVVSGTINTTGCVFDAIGTTPTTYSNGSTLAHYETQSYTYEDLKTELGISTYKEYLGVISQSSTNAPSVSSELHNFTGNPTWTRSSNGAYKITATGEFTSGKTLCFVSSTKSGNDSQWIILNLQRINNNDCYLTGWDVQNAESLADDDLNEVSVRIIVLP